MDFTLRARNSIQGNMYDCKADSFRNNLRSLDSNFFDLIERDLVVRAIVKFGGARTLVGGHGLGIFKRTAVVEIGGNAGGAKSMIADCRGNASVPRAALKHAPRVGLRHRALGQNAGAADSRAEKRTLAIVGETRGLDVVLQVGLEIMMAGHRVFLATFFVQADPEPAVLPIDVRHRHAERGADAREGENQKTDQRPVAQADDGSGVDAVQELARFERTQYRGLASADHVFRPRTAAAGLTASTWPTTSQSNSMRTAASHCLTVGGANLRLYPRPRRRRARVRCQAARRG
jgi:hypothetical protein